MEANRITSDLTRSGWVYARINYLVETLSRRSITNLCICKSERRALHIYVSGGIRK
jgi:hypothetical protein